MSTTTAQPAQTESEDSHQHASRSADITARPKDADAVPGHAVARPTPRRESALLEAFYYWVNGRL